MSLSDDDGAAALVVGAAAAAAGLGEGLGEAVAVELAAVAAVWAAVQEGVSAALGPVAATPADALLVTGVLLLAIWRPVLGGMDAVAVIWEVMPA